jgi:hypothetical protein
MASGGGSSGGNWKTFWVGILGAIIGAVAVVGVTAFGAVEAATSEAKRATGTARVLVDDLRRAGGDLANSLAACSYELYGEDAGLATDDQILLAWRLQPKEWLPVGVAISDLRVQIGRSRAKRPFGHDDVIQIKFLLRAIDEAAPALRNLSGEGLFSKQQVEKALRAVGHACSKR